MIPYNNVIHYYIESLNRNIRKRTQRTLLYRTIKQKHKKRTQRTLLYRTINQKHKKTDTKDIIT